MAQEKPEKKKPDQKKNSDIRVPEKDVKREKKQPSFNDALKRAMVNKPDKK